jgi:hypothetical protein
MGREFTGVVEPDAEGAFTTRRLGDRDRRCAVRWVDLMISAAGVRRIELRLTGHKS